MAGLTNVPGSPYGIPQQTTPAKSGDLTIVDTPQVDADSLKKAQAGRVRRPTSPYSILGAGDSADTLG